jgi:hypothetical protein
LVQLPSFGATITFFKRMFANVPRAITWSLPRRVPYWLKSFGCHAFFLQELTSRENPRRCCQRGNMIGGDRVAEHAKHTRIFDLLMDRSIQMSTVWK